MRHIQGHHNQSYKGKKRKRKTTNHHEERSVLLSEIPNLVEDSESEDDDDDSENEDENLETQPKKSNIEQPIMDFFRDLYLSFLSGDKKDKWFYYKR